MDNFKIRVVVADPHPIMRLGIMHALSEMNTMMIVGMAGSSTDLITLLDETPCDVLVSSYIMPSDKYGDGVALLSLIRRRYPAIRLAVFTMLDNPAVLSILLAKQFSCIVSKSDDPVHLVPAIYAAHTHGSYYSPTIQKVGEAIQWGRSGVVATQTLTERETEIVRLYTSGLSVTAMACQLNKSKKTISAQKARAMAKLGLRQDIDLLRYGMENGFVQCTQAQSRQPSATATVKAKKDEAT